MIEMVPANGHATVLHRPDGLLIELVQLRAVCRRQKAALDKLGEDVAMYRGAAAALTVQNIALRDAAAGMREAQPIIPPTGARGSGW